MSVFASQTDSKVHHSLREVILDIKGLRKNQNIHQFLTRATRKLGIGLTPLLELPEEINPYLKEGIRIFYKPEYLNPSGSGKDRAVSFMLHYYDILGVLSKIDRITTAGYGNFIKSLSILLPHMNFNIRLETFMGEALVRENADFMQFLRDKGVIIHRCDDEYCPTTDSERGKAISWAYLEEKADQKKRTLFLDQHGYYKPFDGLLNAAGYYYSLTPELLHQTKNHGNLYYVNGEGTRGSLMGTGVGLRSKMLRTKIIGLIQEENGHIFGLRSRKQLGKSETLGEVESICDRIFEIRDEEAFQTMVDLWEVGVPASPSGGGYVAGALRVAKELMRKGEEGTIVTMVFDSLELYGNILSLWMPKILNVEFKAYYEDFCDLKSYVMKERKRHVNKLRSGEDNKSLNIQTLLQQL